MKRLDNTRSPHAHNIFPSPPIVYRKQIHIKRYPPECLYRSDEGAILALCSLQTHMLDANAVLLQSNARKKLNATDSSTSWLS